MSGHDAQVQRLQTGWLRWRAWCRCGWTETPQGGREDAVRAAQDHDDMHGAGIGGDLPLACTCYDARSMEYAPNHPCGYCQRLEAEGIA